MSLAATMPGSSLDYRRLLDERHAATMTAISEVRDDIANSGASIQQRLDALTGRVERQESAIHAIELRQAEQGGGPRRRTSDQVQNGNGISAHEEGLNFRASPKVWAGVIAGASALYTLIHAIMTAILSKFDK